MVAWFSKPKYTTLSKSPSERRIPEGLWSKCSSCLEAIVKKDWEEAFQVCPRCGFHDRLTARERIRQLLDEGSFVEHDGDLISGDPLGFKDSKAYSDRLKQAREKTGLNEAVVCGDAKIQGHEVSVGLMDMNFVGGSMGSVVGEKIARALERGVDDRVPVVLVCCSGGARMQEGALSLMQMAKTSAVVARLNKARLPLVTVLTDPTTAGVIASFAMLGDVIIAEPNALVGFTGQRVIEATIKQILPAGFQRSEFVADHGFIDIVCPRGELRTTIGNLLAFFTYESGGKRKSAARADQAAREAVLEEAPTPS